jgi:DNA ligase (NAD+)
MQYFEKEELVQLIAQLKEKGLQLESKAKPEGMVNLLAGKTFVVSGVFEKHSRDEIKSLIEQYGGKNVGSISSKTDFVLAGDKMGPAKRDKAESLGIPIISESDFEEMINT